MNALSKPAPADLSCVPQDAEQAVLRAELGYISDPAQRSLEHWWRACVCKEFGFSTFRRRAHLGRWVERRAEFWRDVSAQVLRERAGALAVAQTRELADLEVVRQRLIAELAKLEIKPRSLEGVIAALGALDRRVEEKRASILDGLPAAPTLEHQREATPLPFTSEELRAAARAVLQVRSAGHRKRQATIGEESISLSGR